MESNTFQDTASGGTPSQTAQASNSQEGHSQPSSITTGSATQGSIVPVPVNFGTGKASTLNSGQSQPTGTDSSTSHSDAPKPIVPVPIGSKTTDTGGNTGTTADVSVGASIGISPPQQSVTLNVGTGKTSGVGGPASTGSPGQGDSAIPVTPSKETKSGSESTQAAPTGTLVGASNSVINTGSPHSDTVPSTDSPSGQLPVATSGRGGIVPVPIPTGIKTSSIVSLPITISRSDTTLTTAIPIPNTGAASTAVSQPTNTMTPPLASLSGGGIQGSTQSVVPIVPVSKSTAVQTNSGAAPTVVGNPPNTQTPPPASESGGKTSESTLSVVPVVPVTESTASQSNSGAKASDTASVVSVPVVIPQSDTTITTKVPVTNPGGIISSAVAGASSGVSPVLSIPVTISQSDNTFTTAISISNPGGVISSALGSIPTSQVTPASSVQVTVSNDHTTFTATVPIPGTETASSHGGVPTTVILPSASRTQGAPNSNSDSATVVPISTTGGITVGVSSVIIPGSTETTPSTQTTARGPLGTGESQTSTSAPLSVLSGAPTTASISTPSGVVSVSSQPAPNTPQQSESRTGVRPSGSEPSTGVSTPSSTTSLGVSGPSTGGSPIASASPSHPSTNNSPIASSSQTTATAGSASTGAVVPGSSTVASGSGSTATPGASTGATNSASTTKANLSVLTSGSSVSAGTINSGSASKSSASEPTPTSGASNSSQTGAASVTNSASGGSSAPTASTPSLGSQSVTSTPAVQPAPTQIYPPNLSSQTSAGGGSDLHSLTPTATDTYTSQAVASSILVAPSVASSATVATSIPSSLPHVIAPPGGAPEQPPNTTLIQIGFLYQLNYPFVLANPQSQKQIFKYTVPGLAYGLGIDEQNVTMQTLRADDTTANLHYVTTLALAYVPAGSVNKLTMDLQIPTTAIYHNPDASVKTLFSMINPAIPIRADDGGPSTISGAAGAPSSSASGYIEPGAPIGGGMGNDMPVRPSSVGIGVGVVCGAAAYGAAMFFVARRYKQRRLSHQRSPSLLSSPVMSGSNHDFASAHLMSGGRGDGGRSTSPLDAYGYGRNSRGSGRSGSTGRQQISAPVMAENSLGWN